MRRRSLFETVQTQGALLPAEFLARIADGDRELPGLTPEAYQLPRGQKINEATNRSWNRLQAAWAHLVPALEGLPPHDPATSLTRERWLLVLFQELGYGRLPTCRTLEVEGKTYPISHLWENTPIHLVGWRVDLDHRTPGVAGAATQSPHSLVQEFLNRSPAHLWGFVSNGRRLRLLRDNVSLTRQAYVEFDLEAMMAGEAYPDFRLLWQLCHRSRVEAERAELCWLERWCEEAQKAGSRSLENLRRQVEEAIRTLGGGFLAHRANETLRQRLRSGALDRQDYYRQVLRLVYRLLFLFAAEDRDLLLDPAAPEEARQRYQAWYSTRRLRDLAERHRGTHHGDLWHGLRLVMQKLGEDGGCPALALPALGSFLWSGQALPDLEGCELANRDLLGALRQLAYLQQDQALLPVDFKNLGAEELGSVYESLLELHPELNLEAGSFELKVAAGHERRRTGSYYTPRELVQCLLDSALEPVVADRLAQARRAARAARHSPEQTRADLEGALLDLKVCDPACGSGHFLIAAAHRLARHLATVRSGEEEPSPPELRRALRDVVGHCLYGVDVNEMAVELCKVALWMEALEPGRPLSFLDSKIQCGNSLLGTTPALLAAGIPDEAFTDLEGDDKKVAAAHKKRHRQERKSGQRTLRHVGTISITARDLPGAHLGSEEGISAGRLTAEATRLEAVDDRTIAGVREKEARYQALLASSTYRRPRLAADAWCAAFLWPRKQGMEAITEATFRQIVAEPEAVSSALLDQVERLARDHCFFHWHLAFPGVFKVLPPERLEELARRAREGNQDPDRAPEPAHPGWEGGFDVALGNPPWERIKIQEREWFAERVPEIAAAPTAAERKRLIEALREKEAGLYQAFQEDLRKAEGESHFLRNSGRYPLCGVGDINTYAVFAETMRALLGPTGRLGCILPPGLATDNTTRHFFRDLVARGQLACLYTFENEERIFPAVDHRVNFTLLTLAGPGKPVAQADFVWFARRAEDLKDLPRHFALTAADIELLNPNTGTCPIFRSSRDAELNKSIYRRVPVLVREGPPEENPWKLEFMAMLHMANDSHLFRTRGQLEQENRHKGGQGEEEPREPEPQGAGPGKGESRSRALPGASSASRPGAGTPEGQGWRLQGNLFCRGSERYLPLYEAKMLHHFDHRFGTYEGQTEAQARMNKLPELTAEQHADLHFLPLPRYWVPAEEVEKRLQGRWDRGWLLGWRDICRTTDERTVIASLLPRVGVGNTVPLMLTLEKPAAVACLYASLCSFIFDYLARQKVGGTHLTYNYLKQLPVLPPSTYQAPCPWSPGQTLADWILPRVLELTYTAWDLEPFARDCGYTGPPFPWDEERRFRLRCELDAAYFHLYGLEEEEVAYVMDTFPIVRRRDEAAHGSFRTKETILHIYRELQARGSSSQGPTGSIFAARLQIRAGNAPGPAGRQGEGSP